MFLNTVPTTRYICPGSVTFHNTCDFLHHTECKNVHWGYYWEQVGHICPTGYVIGRKLVINACLMDSHYELPSRRLIYQLTLTPNVQEA